VKPLYFLTISRNLGSLGDEIAEELSSQLQIPLLNRKKAFDLWLSRVASRHELHMLANSYEFFRHDRPGGGSFLEYLEEQMKQSLETGPAVFLGMASQLVFKDHPLALHLRIQASQPVRIRRIMEDYGLSRQQAMNALEESDSRRKKYVRRLYREDLEDPSLYDLTISTDRISVTDATRLIIRLVESRQEDSGFSSSQLSFFTKDSRSPFHHQIEQEFADILDSYGMRWQYEPSTFPVEWDEEGNIVRAIAPDFYLTDYNTYIELTVMDPRYMSEKRKKVRLLKEQYPDMNIILMDKNSLHSFMERFQLKKGGPAGE